MSATVLSFDLGRRIRAFGPADTNEQRVRSAIRNHLRGRCGPSRIAQAEARAERRVKAGNTIADAVGYAIRWALNASDCDPLPPAA
jgi:hypothetical protein